MDGTGIGVGGGTGSGANGGTGSGAGAAADEGSAGKAEELPKSPCVGSAGFFCPPAGHPGAAASAESSGDVRDSLTLSAAW